MQFSPYSKPIPPVLAAYVSFRNSGGVPWAAASNRDGDGNELFSIALCIDISKRYKIKIVHSHYG